MITKGVMESVFKISFDDKMGSAFLIERMAREYLVTAAHVVEGLSDRGEIEIFVNGEWARFQCRMVGYSSKHDVAALSLPISLTWTNAEPMETTSAGMAYGSDVYFLGYPFGWAMETNIRPYPLVKKGIVSSLQEPFLIDGFNNVGFSGGPVVFVANPQNSPTVFRIAAVVTHCQVAVEPTYDQDENEVGHVEANAGFVSATDIRWVNKLIDENPVGLVRGVD